MRARVSAEEAVAAYRAALEEHTRDRVALEWAATQTNLGNALASLGDHEPGTARLNEAVAAYRAALEEYTRERVPLHWAMTQYNLAISLEAVAGRTGDASAMAAAATSYRDAAEILEAAGHSSATAASEGVARTEAGAVEFGAE